MCGIRYVPAALRILLIAVLASTTAAQDISTVAGGGPPGPPSVFSATKVPIGFPSGVTQDTSGNTYFSDSLSNRVFKVDASSNLSVLAGNSVNNFSGDLGPAVAASLSRPEGIGFDSKTGLLYIADSGNNRIRAVNIQSTAVTLFAGTVNAITIPPGDIATIAGLGARCSPSGTPPQCGDGGAASQAQFNLPGAVVTDSSTGDIYIADTGDHAIRQISLAHGTIAVVAGTYKACTTAPCGDGSSAISATLNSPGGLYVDSSGNLYIADTADSAVRVVNETAGTVSFFGVSIASLVIQTVAGTVLSPCTPAGLATSCGDTSAATAAKLNSPSGVFVDGSGNLWIADSADFVVRQVSTGGTIILIAGSYKLGFSGDGSTATAATLNFPVAVFATSTEAFIADQRNSAIREVQSPNISTFAGEGLNRAYYGDGGAATNAELQKPAGLAFDASGDLLIADSGNNAIREVDTQGNISTSVGTGSPCQTPTCGDNTPATSAQLLIPTDLSFDSSGNIYIADSQDNAIRVVNTTSSTLKLFQGTANELDVQPTNIATAAGTITALAPCSPPNCGDGHAATLALLNVPSGVFVDKSGNLYIADSGDNVVRFVNTQNSTTSPITIGKVSIAPGNIAAIAGNYTACSTSTAACGDGGAASAAQLSNPTSVSVDATGVIYIVDNGDNRIRAVNLNASGSVSLAGVTINSGDIATIAGTGAPGYSGDGHVATSADLLSPDGLFVDSAGDIFIADGGNSVVRQVNRSSGNIQTVAGNSTFGFSGDGGLAIDAELAQPQGLRGDNSGNLFIADSFAWRVRKVTALVATGPTATLSTNGLTFASQALGTTSASQNVKVDNNGLGSNLTVSSVTITGTNAGDFKQTNNCSSVAPGGSCTIAVTFTPAAAGARSASISIADNASGSPQSVTLSGTGVSDFTLSAGALSSSSVTPGQSATSTITVTAGAGFSSSVTLTCSVASSASSPPTCALNPGSVTPTSKGVTSTLTISTTGASSALLRPQDVPRRSIFYAAWLLLPALIFGTVNVGPLRRKKVICGLLLLLVVLGFAFLVACGGGSSSSTSTGGNGGGSSGTPSGAYTVTVTATGGSTTQTATVTLTVQ
ncbi:MAG TPA: choice-of-anchor D domain-containing protein [Terriglobales bacterium]|nr:choice-of-anchor D domain-containing protein [Terriglobales bacterium]